MSSTPLPNAALVDGRFRVLQLLWFSQSNHLYRVQDGRTGQEHLLRVLPGAEPERIRERVAAWSACTHPNLAPILAHGTMAGQVPWVVWEVPAQAHSLRSLLTVEGRLGPPQGLSILVGILQALAALHQQGVVHGALCLDDILLILPAPQSGPWLLLAALGGPWERANVAGPDEVEQEATLYRWPGPDDRPLLPQEDVYAAGVLVFRMLVGGFPLPGLAPEPPRLLKRTISEDLSRLMLRALGATPEGIYADASEMLQGIGEHFPAYVTRRESSSSGRSTAATGARRRRWWWLGLLLGALLGIIWYHYFH